LLIRRKQNAPIVLISEPEFINPYLKKDYSNEQLKKNKQLKTEYSKLVKAGVKNVILIDQQNALGTDNEATVDGVHFNDLGFTRYARYLIKNLKFHNLL
jgi:lysophospholipase L1-like esterase